MSEVQATYQCSLSAQDLRIGNWVYDGERTQFPMQAVALGKDWAHLDFPGNEGGVWEADIKDLRPIAVTVEILKKAGFKWDGGYGHKQWLFKSCDFADFSPRKGFKCKEYFTEPIE